MINKSKEPEKLREFRNECKKEGGLKKEDYDRFYRNCPTGFRQLQDSLLKEQHNLCCYCMKKIGIKQEIKENDEPKPLTVEHFVPKSEQKEGGKLALVYRNLLACCEGKDGNTKFCGNSKGNNPLTMIPNPADIKEAPRFVQKLKYKSNGEIAIIPSALEQYSEKEKTILLKEINEILNLNDEILTKARTAKLNTLINKYKDEVGRKAKRMNKRDFFNKLGYFSYYAFVKSQFLNDCNHG